MNENNGFQKALDHIRSTAGTEAAKGRKFERLMKKYLTEDPVYKERFSKVRLYSEWAEQQAEFDGNDMGIDLVAEEREEATAPFNASATRLTPGYQNPLSTPLSQLRHVTRSLLASSSIPAPNGGQMRKNDRTPETRLRRDPPQ